MRAIGRARAPPTHPVAVPTVTYPLRLAPRTTPVPFISQTKAELLHKQNAQIKELRRKHEAAQLAIAGSTDEEGNQEMQGDEDEEGAGGEEADDDKAGLVVALRKVRKLIYIPWRACSSWQLDFSPHACTAPKTQCIPLIINSGRRFDSRRNQSIRQTVLNTSPFST